MPSITIRVPGFRKLQATVRPTVGTVPLDVRLNFAHLPQHFTQRASYAEISTTRSAARNDRLAARIADRRIKFTRDFYAHHQIPSRVF